MPTCVRVSGGNHVETEIVHKCTPQTSDQFKNQTNDRQISTIPGGQKKSTHHTVQYGPSRPAQFCGVGRTRFCGVAAAAVTRL